MYFQKEKKNSFKFDPYKFDYVIDHGSNKVKYVYHLKRELEKKGLNEADIKKTINEFLLTFYNKSADIIRVVNYITTDKEIKEKDKDDFFYHLYIYLKQFYNNHVFVKEINNHKDLETFINACYQTFNHIILEVSIDDYNLDKVKKHTELLNKIYSFYDIITEFMVRYYGYTIKMTSNVNCKKADIQKCIITTKNYFPEDSFLHFALVELGYTLYKLQRARFIDGENPHYEFDRAMPTKDMGYYIDEYIETFGEYEKPETKKLLKVPNYNPKHPNYKQFWAHIYKS